MDRSDAGHRLTAREREWLRRAVDLAQRGWGRVRPNPMVGCVLVRDGLVVGEGWHQEFGGPHAEVNALSEAGENAAGATAYVTLEPCSHHGKTPPCADALVEAGVARVVFGAFDPGQVAAGGRHRLSASGVEVLSADSDPSFGRDADPAFFYTAERGRPYVALKMAVSQDRCIAAAPGERTALTSDEANREVHRLRSGFDAIMIGAETASVDDPLLTVRVGPSPRVPPTRIVIDSTCRLAPEARLLATVEEAPVVVVVTAAAPDQRIRAIEERGGRVVVVDDDAGRVALPRAMEECWRLGLTSILCEGGGQLASSLVREEIVQRLYLVEAPILLGDQGVPAFPNAPGTPSGPGWRKVGHERRLGPDILITYDREA